MLNKADFPPRKPLAIYCAAYCAAFITSPLAFAEEPQNLPEIAVEAAALPAVNPLTIAPDAVAAPTADGGDYLRSLSGVSAIRMGGHGLDPIIRGQSQSRLNILIDGAYVHGGCPNRMDPPAAYAIVESFDEVKVIKSAQSVEHGGGGSGGTVLFERKAPELTAEKPWVGQFNSGFKSNSNTFDIYGDLATGSEKAFIRGIVQHSEADNYEDGNGKEVRSGYENDAGNLILGFTPDKDTLLEVSIERVKDKGMLYAGAGMDAPTSENDLYRLKFNREADFGIFNSFHSSIYYSDVAHVMDNYSLRPLSAPMKMRVPSTSKTSGGKLKVTLGQHEQGLWTLGMDYQHNQRNAPRFMGKPNMTPSMLQGLLWPDVNISQSGLFLSLDKSLGAQSLLKAGLRYDYAESQAKIAHHKAAGGVSANNLYQKYYGVQAEKTSKHQVGGFAAYEYNLSKQTVLFATLSRSVRTPDATEAYIASNNSMAAMRWVGNPGLNPEVHHQLELGLNWDSGRWHVATSVYMDDSQDFILRDRAHGQDGILLADNATIYRNIDARFYGFELNTSVNWSRNWRSDFDLSYVHAQNTTDDRAIAQTPPLEGNLKLTYLTANMELGGGIRFAAKQTRIDDNSMTGSGQDAGESPEFAVLDLYGRYTFKPALKVSLGVDNLLDKAFAYHVNRANSDPFSPEALRVNEPGRSVWMRMSLDF
ncbi:TonB-dependent copper receptor [Candidatus Venteria ishoeyi]|uniref:Vitamin B12 transporter BtuB n=1 Tax=Candidatus Venteria ishoeyi TaxID=1899563 RepID=A0A1H6FE86_9GAMM|nr:TonB-dependent copper receptor [Candidatus Venteria ishoeyi]MDM8546937.1 TonB-dependent copper receptor [Candidatus Venteria ishoeyi]SEH07476.1 Vitamin B12 transporter BtuB [Candidatus Venteria ishoeyi]